MARSAAAQDDIPVVLPEPTPVIDVAPPDVPLLPPPAPEALVNVGEPPIASETGAEIGQAPTKSGEPQQEGQAAPQGVAAGESGAPNYLVSVFKPKQPYGVSNGSFTYRVDLDLPPFHGVEPSLSLSYSSNRGLTGGGESQGWLAFGWVLGGLDTIERATARRGAPRYSASDIFVWSGEQLNLCTGAGAPSATCASPVAGITNYFSRVESYLRFQYQSATNSWTITNREGVKTVLRSVQAVGGLPACPATPSTAAEKQRCMYRWFPAQIIDTRGNTASLSYVCSSAPQCVPNQITYTGTAVKFFWETRPDVISYGTGVGIGRSTTRLRSVRVTHGGSIQKAYVLVYQQNSVTNISRLAEIRQYGSDVVLDAAGAVVSGSMLPKHSFQYSQAAKAFTLGPVPPDPGGEGPFPHIGRLGMSTVMGETTSSTPVAGQRGIRSHSTI